MKTIRQLILICFARIVCAANLAYLSIRELGVTVPFAGAGALGVGSHAVPVATGSSPLMLHVVRVCLVRAKKQMQASNARLVVALMANERIAGIASVLNQVRDSMRAVLGLMALGKPGVAARHKPTAPFPTLSLRAETGAFINERPKAIDVLRRKGRKFTIFNRHDVTSETGDFVLRAASVFQHRGGLSILPQECA